MATKKIPYVNRFNGDIKIVTKQSAKKLSEDYTEVKFVKNEHGKQVMRLELNGATVDVSENEQPIELEGQHGNRDTE